jgi:hypothetical protein
MAKLDPDPDPERRKPRPIKLPSFLWTTLITKTILTFTPADALDEKDSEAGGNNTEQWNRNQKDVL